MHFLKIPLISLLFLGLSHSSEVKWTHREVIKTYNGRGPLYLNWVTTQVNNIPWLTMEISAETSGYLAVGFSPNGGMDGADMVIGWIDSNGTQRILDVHGRGIADAPKVDPTQNYELLKVSEDNGRITMRFRRPWDTCDDQHDFKITNDTIRLIWSYGDDKPTDDHLPYHGPLSRGVQNLFISDLAKLAPFPDEDGGEEGVKNWDMLLENNTVDGEFTTYFCKIFKFPDLEKKHHLIGYKPIISEESKPFVHHITAYECYIPPELGGTENEFEQHLTVDGGRCFTPTMPPSWGKYCTTFLFVWLIGSKGEMWPGHVGTPLGEKHGGHSYFMIETHYDNPLRKTFVDTSGVRLFYTDNLRKEDSAFLLVGHRISPFQMIPPRQTNFVNYAICSRECTQKSFPKDGIKITSVILHAHLQAKKLKLRHIRAGIELPNIANDDFYNFNYQQNRYLPQEVTILPGDELLLECEYQSKDKDQVVLGGLSTTQEMCQAFMLYYPRVELNNCGSQPEFYGFFRAFGIKNISGSVIKAMNMPYNPTLLSPEEAMFDPMDNAKELEGESDGESFRNVFDRIDIQDPEDLKGVSVGEYIRNRLDWNDQKFGDRVEERWKNGKHYSYCTAHGRRRIPLDSYEIPFTKIVKPLPKKRNDQCKSKQLYLSSTGTSTQPLFFLVLAFILKIYFN